MFTVAAFYKFAPFDDPAGLRAPLLAAATVAGIRGTILLAHEGINGTMAGHADGIGSMLDHIRALPGCGDLDVKYSTARTMPFQRLKVRVKREIVTLGIPGIDPSRDVGVYVAPAEWNAVIDDPDTVVIDTRNDYEVAIGSFAGAIDPGTRSFGTFPEWFAAHREELAGKRIAMFCTGGIRCEKSTAFVRTQGFDDVVHLKGGILAYLEQVAAAESRWQGECFVFDERVSVGQGLAVGTHELCRACRMPINAADRGSSDFIEGQQCPHCAAIRTDEDRARYAERHRQVQFAETRGYAHLGEDAVVKQPS